VSGKLGFRILRHIFQITNVQKTCTSSVCKNIFSQGFQTASVWKTGT